MLTQENKNKIDALRKQFPDTKSLTIPALHIAQEQYGWVSEEAMKDIALLLNLPESHIIGVATFYTMFNKKPVGKYHIQVCTNVSCQLLGSEKISRYICNKLNIKVGETTSDKKFTISEVECLGSCGTAPMMQVNDDYHENLTPEKIDKILQELK
ncbi:MAG: NADH-quinone oxidoreductase subunit NuoE [Ignavibacteriales bacterium]|nr:NADH-quinone oxidoreductase subunit NuoE [Ignavibacteriales bacterium]